MGGVGQVMGGVSQAYLVILRFCAQNMVLPINE